MSGAIARYEALDAPKRQMVGQWAHHFPNAQRNVALDPAWGLDTWETLELAWLDYWLKGVPPGTSGGAKDLRLGTVDYQDSTAAWNESASWPPVEARDEVLYLSGEEIAGRPSSGDRRFRSVPTLPRFGLCGDPGGASATYLTEAVQDELLLAGNPFAYLNIESDANGGIVTVAIADLPPDFTCETPSDARWITRGAVDLRRHASHLDGYEGGLDGQDFETGEPTNIRIDLFDLAERIPAGHRLAVVVSYGDGERSGQPYFPEITVHADGSLSDSQIVLPIIEGSLGGKKPRIDYPPRPFVPN